MGRSGGRIALAQGSLAENDERFEGFDCHRGSSNRQKGIHEDQRVWRETGRHVR